MSNSGRKTRIVTQARATEKIKEHLPQMNADEHRWRDTIHRACEVCVAPTLDYNLQLSHSLLRDPLGAVRAAGLNLEDDSCLNLRWSPGPLLKN
jgi:hypothetical protein